MKRYFLIMIYCVSFFELTAQKVVSVATQRFEEKASYKAGDVLKLKLEKARVTITGKNQNHYDFEIIFKSKHKNQEQAVKELGYLKYQLRKSGDTLYFSNDFISGDSFQKVQGILNVELIISAPRTSRLVIENVYGATRVSNLTNDIYLTGKFVETTVSKCRGDLSLTSVFGDNRISEHEGDIMLNLSRVDLIASQTTGSIRGETNYGNVELTQLRTHEVTIEARRTAFTLELDNESLNDFSYDLATQAGSILLEGAINKKIANRWQQTSTSKSSIKIRTTFSPIIIRDKSLNVRK